MCRRLSKLTDTELRYIYAKYQNKCGHNFKRFAKDALTDVMLREVVLCLDGFHRTQRSLYGCTFRKHLGSQCFIDYVRITVFPAHF